MKKKVLMVGVFDFFHIGHLNVIEQAKKYGDYIIVAVHDDKLNIKGVDFLYSLEERMRLVENIKFVDKVIPYERVDLIVKEVEFDVFMRGPDQNHEYFQKAFDWCRKNNKEIVTSTRTEGISSTRLREILKNKDI